VLINKCSLTSAHKQVPLNKSPLTSAHKQVRALADFFLAYGLFSPVYSSFLSAFTALQVFAGTAKAHSITSASLKICKMSDCLMHQHYMSLPRASALYVGLARTIYIRCIYGIFGREITKYTVIYGVIYTVLANPNYMSLPV